jgi:hypothetical protein
MRALHNIRVAGVTYENRQSHLAKLTGNEPVRLIPEPTNEYDPNAIAVHIAVKEDHLVEMIENGEITDTVHNDALQTVVRHCGYIPRELAKDIAPFLDGESLDCSIEQVIGGFLLENGDIATYGLRLLVVLPEADDHAYINDYHDKPFQ